MSRAVTVYLFLERPSNKIKLTLEEKRKKMKKERRKKKKEKDEEKDEERKKGKEKNEKKERKGSMITNKFNHLAKTLK